MEFRIADTFIDSLAKLTNQEQKAAKTTVFDLQVYRRVDVPVQGSVDAPYR